MGRSHSPPWSDETTSNNAIPSRWPWNPRIENTPTFAPPEFDNSSGMELSRLGGYAMVIALMAGCMLLNAWSRIDLRETAVALDQIERAHTAALEDATRFELELATLEDPGWLVVAAEALELVNTVPVIDMKPATPR